MSDQPENIVLVYLRRLDEKLDRVVADIGDIKRRVTALEIGLGNLAASEMAHYANGSLRADRQDERLDRIERRLDLTETA